tara:strand:- start:351 stop:983 length:633 start_codon:yes stop_codon:yes gene_type:complete
MTRKEYELFIYGGIILEMPDAKLKNENMNFEEYLEIINSEPSASMVCEHRNPNGDLEYRYIRKSVLQSELNRIYRGHVRWEMIRDTVASNGLYGTGKLEVKHPVSGDWIYFTGVASLPHERSMRLNYPKLEAHCMINACKKIGAWFGQRLNIDEDDEMEVVSDSINIADEKLEILIEEASTLEQLSQYKKNLPSHLKVKYMAKLKTFIEK